MSTWKHKVITAVMALGFVGGTLPMLLPSGGAQAPAAAPSAPQLPGAPSPMAFDRSTLTIDTSVGERKFDVELALTPEQHQRGLMFRKTMGAMEGMLFDNGTERPTAFWMANTLIPLDMLFIAGDGTIVRIHANAVPLSTDTIPSGAPVRGVLELNGGAARMLGIKPGDKVRHAIFGNAK